MTSAAIVFDVPYKAFDGGIIEDAFHGTSAESATEIMAKRFRPGTKPDWYGPGTYFFESDHQAACWWAKDHRRVEHPVVIRARVDLGRTLYLNLLGKQADRAFEILKARIGARLAEGGRALKRDDAYSLLRAAVTKGNYADSFRVARAYDAKERPFERGGTFRVEIMVIVWDTNRITPLEVLTPEALGATQRFGC